MTADVVIVGAGYTGLACAHRLACLRPDSSVVVVDALRVGEGSAGRNSGFVIDVGHWRPGWGVDANRSAMELGRLGVELLRERVRAQQIACDWFEGGRYHVAVNRRGQRALAQFRGGLDKLGVAYTDVGRDALAKAVGSTHYCEAAHVEGGAFVQPAALVRGLAASLPDNVTLIERTPVATIERGPPFVLSSPDRQIRASRLVLAVNGYTGPWGIARGRVLPLVTYASVTEPLAAPPGAGEQWGLIPEELMGCTVRLTADRRILIRSGVALRHPPPIDGPIREDMARRHRQSFEMRFPDLASVPFSHSWGGVLGMTLNAGTLCGPMGDDAWVCAAHNGVGIALGTGMGDALAHMAAGESHPRLQDLARLPAPAWMPPEPLRGVGIRLYTACLGMLAGDER